MSKRIVWPDGTTFVRGPKPTKAQKKAQRKLRTKTRLLQRGKVPPTRRTA